MSMQNINYDPANSGLGDTLRQAFIKVMSNFTELYANKVDKITGKVLSDTNFTQDEKDKLALIDPDAIVQSDWDITDSASPAFILNKPQNTSDFNNDGEDGINPFATKEYVDNADDQVLSDAKAYSDAIVVGLWDDRGNFTPTTSYPSTGGSGDSGTILKGDIWTISGLGSGNTATLPIGQIVQDGDTIRALIDNPSNTQANWAIQQQNIGYTPEDSINKIDDISGTSSIKYTSEKAVKNYVDNELVSKATSTLGVANSLAKFTDVNVIRNSNYYDDGAHPIVDKGLIVSGDQTEVSSGSTTVKLGVLNATPNNCTDAFVVQRGTGGIGASGDLVMIPRTSTGINASVIIATGSTTPVNSLEVTASGTVKLRSSIQVSDDSNSAASSNVGAIRYRVSGNNSYIDMVMQTGASTYAWINIVQNNW